MLLFVVLLCVFVGKNTYQLHGYHCICIWVVSTVFICVMVMVQFFKEVGDCDADNRTCPAYVLLHARLVCPLSCLKKIFLRLNPSSLESRVQHDGSAN